MIKGVGKDAEVITNSEGGKQSKTGYAMYLIDPEFLANWFEGDLFIAEVTEYMVSLEKYHLSNAIFEANLVNSSDDYDAIIKIAEVLKEGAEKYEANNWRLIPAESHLNHALIHYFAYKLGDTQDDHLSHCLCRLMMAYATKESEGFSYTKYTPSRIENNESYTTNTIKPSDK